jgi:hypothetical protein
MFIWLNRLLKLLLWSLALLAVALIWQQRWRARPVADYWQLWHDVGFNFPERPPVQTVTPVRVLSDTLLHVRDSNKLLWAISFEGLQGVPGQAMKEFPEARAEMATTRTNIMELLNSGTVEVAITKTTPERIGSGHFFVNSNLVAVPLVAQGRLILNPERFRTLPLKEQYELRLADRHARAERKGIWAMEHDVWRQMGEAR